MIQMRLNAIASMFLICLLFLPLVAECQESSEKQEKEEQKQVKDIGEGSLRNIGIQGASWADRNRPATENAPADRRKNDKSITDQNGQRTVSFDRVGGRLVVSITRRYDPRDLKQLRTRHPELAEYVEMFPKQIDGDQIDLKLAITSRHEARNEEELKKKSLEAFNLYRRYFDKVNRSQR